MSVNQVRGEVKAQLDGKCYRLCLTLNALAELEAKLNEPDLLSLVRRLTSGKLKSKEAISILGAGLRGGGHNVDDQEISQMQFDGGVVGMVNLVADLLNSTFGSPSDNNSRGIQNSKPNAEETLPGKSE